ncbi:MAG: SDR family oxidoreductase [Halomonas sp.]|nr:SDR family oxidoreductase [Halomonas sp.]MCC5903774.1 SDR family oxidoreductase [Halomonas sp.]
MRRFENKNVVVIGGTHGMGLATVKALIDGGAHVCLTGNNEENIDRAKADLGAGVTVIRSDASSLSDIDTLRATVSDVLGTIDALLVFAAVAEFEPFESVSEASFDRQFALNTKGAFFVAQRLAPLIKDGGSITFTTVTPATGSPHMSVYMGTKAAVRAFTQAFAAELLARRIRVNALAPGFIDTPSLGLASLTPEARQEVYDIGNQITPMKRHGTVAEIACGALFLAFDATFSTGIELPLDGGLSTVDCP